MLHVWHHPQQRYISWIELHKNNRCHKKQFISALFPKTATKYRLLKLWFPNAFWIWLQCHLLFIALQYKTQLPRSSRVAVSFRNVSAQSTEHFTTLHHSSASFISLDLLPEHLERNCKRSEILSARFVLGTAIELMNCCCPIVPMSQIGIFPSLSRDLQRQKLFSLTTKRSSPWPVQAESNRCVIQTAPGSSHTCQPCIRLNRYTVLLHACCTSCTLAFPTTCHHEEAHIRSLYCHASEQTPCQQTSWSWPAFEQKQVDSAIIYT